MSTVFSGIQPSTLHIGNYLGAISQWIPLQQEHECLFCIVDLHALTSQYSNIAKLSFETAALYIACGIDPQKSHLFIQSHVPFHSELFWLLSSKTPFGWLNRMTQFKSSSHKESSVGLFTYPVLMAADILLYNTKLVPVGADQKQHVEFTRDLAERFNTLYKQDIFTLPEPMIPKNQARIMSLRDGTNKMSKSDPSSAACLFLSDSDDALAMKIKKAKTDPLDFPSSLEDMKDRPEITNLFSLLSALSNQPTEDLLKSTTSCAQLKENLTESAIATIRPIREKMVQLAGPDQQVVLDALQQGAKHAYSVAYTQFEKVRKLLLNS